MRRRVLTALAVGAILLALTVGTYQGLLARRPLPTIDGYYRLLGLHQRAEVTRDAFGIPRIEAGDLHDLFFLQGYVTAQDRFAQMEAMRQGPSLVLLDALPAGDLGVALEAYAEGVTKFIAQHAEARALPAEVALTGRRPAPWTAKDSLAILAAYLNRPQAVRCVAIDGGRTVRGRPLLSAELMHYAPAPGFYEIGLQADEVRALGTSLPGVPGIVSGHNGEVAWSLLQPDSLLDPIGATLALVSALTARDVAEVSAAFGSIPFCAADTRAVAGPTLDHLDRPFDVELIRSFMDRPRPTDAGARLIIDLGDLDASKSALSTGQSGHPAAFHYLDQRALWEVGQLHALTWTREEIARVEAQLVLRAR